MSKQDINCSFCGAAQARDKPLIAGANAYICEECIKLAQQMVTSWSVKTTIAETFKSPPIPEAIKKHLDGYVIGQEDAKETLSVAVYNHYKRLNYSRDELGSLGDNTEVEIEKSNILLIGPSGSGKTLLARSLAWIVNVPFVTIDATTMTQAGYVGDDVEIVLQHLLEAAEGHVGRAEWGIVYIDEIDKIARSPGLSANMRDVSGEGVQQALLRLVEGGEVSVTVRGKKQSSPEKVAMDTRNVLFIIGGAFQGLSTIVEKRVQVGNTNIGFHAQIDANMGKSPPPNLLSGILTDDLRHYGLIDEFIGRFPVIATLDPLNEKDLVRILTETRNAITQQYKKLLAMDGIELDFTDGAILSIAHEALHSESGARGLRGVLERILRRVMFQAPSNPDIIRCVVDEAAVAGDSEVQIIFSQDDVSLREATANG